MIHGGSRYQVYCCIAVVGCSWDDGHWYHQSDVYLCLLGDSAGAKAAAAPADTAVASVIRSVAGARFVGDGNPKTVSFLWNIASSLELLGTAACCDSLWLRFLSVKLLPRKSLPVSLQKRFSSNVLHQNILSVYQSITCNPDGLFPSHCRFYDLPSSYGMFSVSACVYSIIQ